MNRHAQAIMLVVALLAADAEASLLPLPGGPLFFNVSTAEQYSPSNDIDNPLNAAARIAGEGNWGIVQVDSIQRGVERLPSGWQIDAGGPAFFTDAHNGGPQILGAFHGVRNNTGTPGTSTGGILDLYYWSAGSQSVGQELSSALNLAKRSADGTGYQDFTCQTDTATCTFLARFLFTPGADLSSQINTIYSAPGSSDFETYMSIDRSRIGAWTDALDTEYFSLNPAQQACGQGSSCPADNDLRVDGRFTQNGAGAWSVVGTDVFGLSKTGAMRAFVPEPASLLLAVAALTALIASRRRPGATGLVAAAVS